jgi:MoaA/NifB/PqqE/SkfB family radical SAM enzyme
LVYDLPVPYSKLNPVSLELEGDVTAVEGQGRSWLYVEPDGDVLPGQGILHNLGNLVQDSWMSISLKRKLYLSQ